MTHTGLHPLWTHALVNMPMMFGPMAILLAVDTLHALRHALRTIAAHGPLQALQQQVSELPAAATPCHTAAAWAL